LDKSIPYRSLKTGLIACFFLLCFSTSKASDNVWTFDAELQKAYELILNLRTEEASQLLMKSKKSNEWHKNYLLSLSETIDVLISEDEKKFELVDEKIRQRISQAEDASESAETLFLQAELTLQRAFNYINLNQNVSATFTLRKAYNLTQECLKKYPNFIPIKKTSGVIQVMVGSIPDKFSWLVSLMGMHGSVPVGQKQLEELRLSKSSLSLEATILFFTIKGFINLQFEDAARGIQDCLKADPDNRLLLFIGVNMYFKSSQSEEAYKLIEQIDKNKKGLQIVYLEYIKAETLLQRGDYGKAIPVYQNFIKTFNSKNLKKDSYYKIAICYWLLNELELAKQNYEKAKVTGREMADPDKYAAKQMEDPKLPNAKILSVRFFTDGGYFKEANEAMQLISYAELKTLKEQTEYFYRKGRLAHKTSDIRSAKSFYERTIEMTGDNSWYFAPNAALQLGYIAQSEKNYALAKQYYQKALTYKRHEYKSSIDTKAKAGLKALKSK
jgi:tetratricopeptide (TPR) repeat protein